MDRPAFPMERKDFWKVGPVWIWKWFVLAGLLTLALAVVAALGLPLELFSPPEGDPPAYRYDDPRLRELSGTVRILDGQGTVRYRGEVAEGSFTGRGQVFDAAGRMVYDGPLADGAREGAGARVYEDGVLVYDGEMASDLPNGPGREYGHGGVLLREGEFQDGLLWGEGTEYVESGGLRYLGEFQRGIYQGQGKLYDPATGTPVYEGEFQQGIYHGQGKLYDPAAGTLAYEGEFQQGIYHGQGKLYDAATGTLTYEGEFQQGEPSGVGRIYHPSGQLLYEGAVSGGRPRADAFLGLSLAEVEAAFTGHWLLYLAKDGSAAFVYPYFQLMFWTDGPVRLTSLTQEEARAERERQELLAALALPAAGGEETAAPQETPPAKRAEPTPKAEPAQDMALDRNADKSGLVIREVLSWGFPLAGAAQPEGDAPIREEKPGWRESFSDFAAGRWTGSRPVVQTGPFVYEFPVIKGRKPSPVRRLLAEGGGVETATVYRAGEDAPLWYQSAAGKEGP